jgi:hypothetical protein
MTRTEALQAVAGMIARDVPDLPGLISLLESSDNKRLAAALRMRMRGKPGGIGGSPRPDPEVWRRQAERGLR